MKRYHRYSRVLAVTLSCLLAVPTWAQEGGTGGTFDIAPSLTGAKDQIVAIINQALPIIFPLFALIFAIGLVWKLIRMVAR